MVADLYQLASDVDTLLTKKSLLLVTAESCTGGGVAQIITASAGASGWFERGFVTYSNLSKQQMLGVDKELIVKHGAVSEEVAAAMAAGALKNSAGDVALSITGIAGPSSDNSQKPVGMVCFGFAKEDKETVTFTQHFDGDRQMIRGLSVVFSLENLLKFLG